MDPVQQQIKHSIGEFKSLVNDMTVNKSIFLKCAFFLAELRQHLPALGNCSPQSLQTVLSDVQLLESIARRSSGRGRLFLLCKSHHLAQEIQQAVTAFFHHLHSLLLADEHHLSVSTKEQLSELTENIGRASFSADSGNEELADELCMAARFEIDEQSAVHLSNEITKRLGTGVTLQVLKSELLEDKRWLEAQNMQADVVEVNRLAFLLDTIAPYDTKRQSFQDSFSEEAIPTSFLCPISGQMMREPVLVEGGVTYEKSAIMEWLSMGNTRCPITNSELTMSELVPNRSLETAMQQYAERLNIDRLTRYIKQMKQDLPDVKEATVDTLHELIETNSGSNFKRHVVVLDGVEPLVELLKSSTTVSRGKLLQLLDRIAAAGDDCKVCITKAGAVPLLLRILTKCHGHNPDAVNVLLKLSEVLEGKDAIVSEQGSIITIASAVNIESPEQKAEAGKLLHNLCQSYSWVAIEAASSGVFEALISNLQTGDKAVKLEMASAIGMKLELNEVSTAALVSKGVVKPLLDMLDGESSTSNLAAAKSLGKLSGAGTSKTAIIESGAVPVIMRHLVSELKELQVVIIFTLANLMTERECAAGLSQENNVSRFLELTRDDDSRVQQEAVRILHYLAKQSTVARILISRSFETVQYLIQLLPNCPASCRSNILGLLFQLSVDRESRNGIKLSPETVQLLMKLLEENVSSEEKEAVLGILAGTAKSHQDIRQSVIAGNYTRLVVKCLQRAGSPGMKEHAAALLTRLTAANVEQVYEELAKLDVTSLLKETLQNGSDRAREHSAANLANLCRRTPLLTEKQTFLSKLLAMLGLRQYRQCAVHAGKCNSRTSFCLVEAGVVPLLINEVTSSNIRNAERGIDALLTLLEDESCRDNGVDYLVKNSVLPAVVGLVGKSPRTTEKAVLMLERIFRRRKYRENKYSRIARSSLSTTMTSGTIEARKSAAKALMHLGLITRGSTYSTTGSFR